MIIMGDSKTHSTVIDRTKRQKKIYRYKEDRHYMIQEINKINVINRYRIL